MARQFVAWRLRRRVALLDEDEWLRLEPLLISPIEAIKAYRKSADVGLQQAREAIGERGLPLEAMQFYEDLTGERLEHYEELWAVRMADYGAPCPNCAALMRTPRAKLCAECGHQLPCGLVAGPCLP